jgi:hypothetical protein
MPAVTCPVNTYLANGVWAAPHPEFPISNDEACFTVKIVGIIAVTQTSIARLVIPMVTNVTA